MSSSHVQTNQKHKSDPARVWTVDSGPTVLLILNLSTHGSGQPRAAGALIIIIIIIIIIYLFPVIGMLPVGSGYFTRKQNMKLVTTEFKSDVWLTVHRNSVWIRKTN